MPSPAPWHRVVRLKDELRTGELALAEFAADLHEVVAGAGRRPIYEDPARFFALTYPTHALRELARDVAARLAGRSAKAVRQLEMTYGGGKTHTLITLHHLFHDPAALPELPAVREFREHADVPLPRAATAALCFDKIDVEKGIEGVRAPDGSTRALRHPWSVLAYQLAGDDGLRILHADDLAEERGTPPAEPLIVRLIERQQRDGASTLILVDEVMMYARSQAAAGGDGTANLRNFFQYLTQAAAKVDRTAIVASLLATEPDRQNDTVGKRVLRGLANIFRRQAEEGVQPVQREDVAEVLARRFFEPESISDRSAYKAHVIGVVKGIARIDDATRRSREEAEERFLATFPFHPDLIDVFYGRWTQIEGFQRTRGILRTLATALRDAEPWDASPLVGPAALLNPPGAAAVSEAVRDLAKPASMDSVEGRRTEWATLLDAELGKAREAQKEVPALAASREVEQAVIAVFLHSQPVGAKANTPELLRMAGGSSPDPIELEKGLRRWRDTSWFLDDADLAEDAGEPGAEQLPRSWRLGNAPNLRQMHDEACRARVPDAAVEERLVERIAGTKALTVGAAAAGARVHKLPGSPREVPDDGDFRYVVLGPEAASASGKPSRKARAFLDHTTGPRRPRVHRNAVVLAVPSREGLDAARISVRNLLGWEDVERQLAGQTVDAVRSERLRRMKRDASQKLPGVIRQTYSIVATVSERNEVHAFKLAASGEPLFAEIKADDRTRITDTPVNAEALLPGGPYDLWREGDESRLVSELAGAFARHPRLTKVLNPQLVAETVLAGVRDGLFVARLRRPDGSERTWWREEVHAVAKGDAELEILLPENARIESLNPALLSPGALPGLWGSEGDGSTLEVLALLEYFSGGRVATIPRDGYDDVAHIPACGEEAVLGAVDEAVRAGGIWMTNPPATLWKEEVPPGILNANAILRPEPPPLTPQELMPQAAPSAWRGEQATGLALSQALSQERATALPWGLVRDGIGAAVRGRWLTLTDDSAPVDSSYDQAGRVVVRKPKEGPVETAPAPASGELDLGQIQDLADRAAELLEAAGASELTFRVGVSLEGDAGPEVRAEIDRILAEVSGGLKSG